MNTPRLTRRSLMGLLASTVALPAFAQNRATVAAVNYPLTYFAERLAGWTRPKAFPINTSRLRRSPIRTGKTGNIRTRVRRIIRG